ncbi:MAG: DUF935 family protein [Acidobacterium ailaaui]|nr:DUF935 family protein [Pseudacidobacterium ailaaui]
MKQNNMIENEKIAIIQNIIIRPIVRQMQDIQKWRQAHIAAESLNPIRVALYDIYHDILLDTTLKALIEKRILGVTKTPLIFVDSNGQEIKEITELTYSNEFRKLRREIMLQRFWGITLLQLTIENGKLRVYSIPRKHVRPDKKMIVWEQYGTEGIRYNEPPYNQYIVQIGEDTDLGLLLEATPLVLYKRGAFADWSKFTEMFGMPFREFRYDGYNDDARRELERLAQEYGAGGYAILPKEAEFKLHEVSSSTNGDVYDALRLACNQELSILILGQTETTMSSTSSGYAQSKTHAEVEDDINENDRLNELGILNELILPVLSNLGYPVENGSFNYAPASDQLSIREKADVYSILKNNLQLQIPDEYLYDEFGIPKPNNPDKRADITAANAATHDEPGLNKLRKMIVNFFAHGPA